MPATNRALTGDERLTAVTEAMVGLHQRYHDRKPVTVRKEPYSLERLIAITGRPSVSRTRAPPWPIRYRTSRRSSCSPRPAPQ
jgi:hypothetical protein